MHSHPGVFIVLEGADGSGKSTQFRLTAERLKAVGHEVEIFKFPQYDEPSSTFVKAYLDGDYGPASEVSPYTASMFYALDRYHASSRIKKALADGKVVVADRYVGSNMAHQGSKFTNLAERRGFFIWEDSLEFELLGIPRPNINIFLRVPVEVSLGLIGDRPSRSYTDKKLDQHEADSEHLRKTIQTYDLLCKLFPKDFAEIDCAPGGQLLGIVQINDQIWEALKPLLPRPKHKARESIVKLDGQADQKQSSKSTEKTSLAQFSGLSLSLSKFCDQTLAEITRLQQKMRKINDIDKAVLGSAIELTTPLAGEQKWLDIVIPKPKSRPRRPDDDPIAIDKILDEIATPKALPTAKDIELKLVKVIPRNELDLLGQDQTAHLAYRQKHSALQRKLARSFTGLDYTLAMTASYSAFKHLLDDGLAARPHGAHPSARLEHEFRSQIAEAPRLDELFIRCFNLSANLYNRLLSAGWGDLALRVLLKGHINYWQFKLDLEALSTALASGKAATKSEVLNRLVDLIAEVHPLTAQALAADVRNSSTQKVRPKG